MATKKASAAERATKQTPATKTPAKKTPATKTPAKKAPAKRAPVKKAPQKQAAANQISTLVVRADEKPWTVKEVSGLRGELESDRDRLQEEVSAVEQGLQDLLRDGGDGAGNDQADVGSTTLERDAEMSLANNSREMLFQVQRALGRLDDGTYGVCESCGNPIGKLRLMAFPRATLCLTCKQREERR
jgi:DnaK suppressor protein